MRCSGGSEMDATNALVSQRRTGIVLLKIVVVFVIPNASFTLCMSKNHGGNVDRIDGALSSGRSGAISLRVWKNGSGT